MPVRFAIYLVPPLVSLLWERGCRWLGRDPESGVVYTQPTVPGMAVAEVHALTRLPRTYGFHATLKAPFRLCDGADENALLDRVQSLAGTLPALAMPDTNA